MLHLYNERHEKEPLVGEIACDWMKRNPDVWSQWKPSDLTVKMELYIGGIFPISGPFYKSGPGMVPGIVLLDILEKKSNSHSIASLGVLRVLTVPFSCPNGRRFHQSKRDDPEGLRS